MCVFCFLFVLSFLVWFFLWPPEEMLTLLFFLHHENGDFSILMKILSLEYFFSAESPTSQAEYMFSIIVYRFRVKDVNYTQCKDTNLSLGIT
jgi:hypothetical protein